MKRILLLTFLISFGVANAQGVWTQKADIPIAAYKQGGAAFSIAGKGYIGAGFNGGSNTNDFWEYNPANNVWTQKAAFPGVIRKWLVGFSIGNKGYMGLGYNGTAFNDFYEYDPATDTWTQLGNFPGTLRYSCVSFVIVGKAYISTGKNTSSSASSETWEYDPSTDLWTQKANMAGGSRNDAIGFAIGNYGYVGAGYNGYNKTDFWQFDPIANTWLQKANCIYGGYSCSAFSIDTLGYFYNGLATSPNFYCYSPSSNTWTQRPAYAQPTHPNAQELTIGSMGYIIGGGSPSLGYYYRDCYEYNPATMTSMNETTINENTISIYPNPTKGKITVECEGMEKVEVIDVAGKLVYEITVSSNKLDMDISTFSKGVYFVKVSSQDAVAVERIVLE